MACFLSGSKQNQDHTVGNVECRSNDASGEAVDDDSNVICLHASCVSTAVAQFAIHSQIASQGTGVVNVLMWIWRCNDYLHAHLKRILIGAQDYACSKHYRPSKTLMSHISMK
jgi:hypothetical protein